MSDETKTEVQTTTEQKSSEAEVTISQEKLNSLINEKFKKGAEKSKAELLDELGVESLDDLKNIVKAKAEADEAQKTELQKLTEQIEAERLEKEALAKKSGELEKANAINKLAAKHGIKEVDYFALQLSNTEQGDDFNMETFVEGLKESKPFVFGEAKKAKTDTSGNNNDDPNDLNNVVKNLSFRELQALQKSL